MCDLNHHPLEHKVCNDGPGDDVVKIVGWKSLDRFIRQLETFIIGEKHGFGSQTNECSDSALIITGRIAYSYFKAQFSLL